MDIIYPNPEKCLQSLLDDASPGMDARAEIAGKPTASLLKCPLLNLKTVNILHHLQD